MSFLSSLHLKTVAVGIVASLAIVSASLSSGCVDIAAKNTANPTSEEIVSPLSIIPSPDIPDSQYILYTGMRISPLLPETGTGIVTGTTEEINPGSYTFQIQAPEGYVFDKNGQETDTITYVWSIVAPEWVETPEGTRYGSADYDLWLTDSFVFLNDAVYILDDNGYRMTGLQVINGETRLFSADGQMLTGWQDYNGGRGYFDLRDGVMVTGLTSIDGKCYYLDPDTGFAQTGWQTIGRATYYFGSDGAALTGLQRIDRITYCFDAQGCMKTGLQTIDGKRYYFADDGSMQTGWQTAGGSKYYFGNDGVSFEGLQRVGGSSYYFGTDGRLKTGLQIIEGSRYFFGEDGAMQTGWLIIGGQQYYFGRSGAAVTGWQTIDGKRRYFDESGRMYSSTKQTIDGKVCCFASDGSEMDSRWYGCPADLEFAPDSQRYYNAASYAGRWVTISGPFKSEYYASSAKGRPWYINIGDATNEVTLVIWGDAQSYYRDFTNDADTGKITWITVSGKLYWYKGELQISTDNIGELKWWYSR